MKKCLFWGVLMLAAVMFTSGCRSSASNCFTRNGSRVPSNSNLVSNVPSQVYPVENVIWSSPANSCTPCAPNACTPCAANACDPCGSTRTGSGYPGVLPGISN